MTEVGVGCRGSLDLCGTVERTTADPNSIESMCGEDRLRFSNK